MVESVELTLDLINESECADLTIKLSVDDQHFYNNKVSPGTHHIITKLNLEEGTHTFNITLQGKTFEHTRVDESGNILSDVLIKVTNVELDEINIDQLMTDFAIYSHNNNGSSELHVDQFSEFLGCNGTVTLTFTSPLYLWLLEHM